MEESTVDWQLSHCSSGCLEAADRIGQVTKSFGVDGELYGNTVHIVEMCD